MSAPAELPLFTVFEGSSPEDVSHARLLWSSLSLLPPLESRLVSADIRQRLPVSRPQRSSSSSGGTSTTGPKRSASLQKQQQQQPSLEHALPQRPEEERQRYAAMADQRRETMALLRRQRERRIRRELLSVDLKPKLELGGGEKRSKLRKPPDCEVDEELVKQLQ
ncbi:cilia- and flagella-associated protein HOATZ [Cebidichthys violaceus]|uniref:cilia- and flagella-associated protein HOATZ n=1 Tax=Cebidichthys violaceus TaxID=271503 RepID=UPI0035CA0F5A